MDDVVLVVSFIVHMYTAGSHTHTWQQQQHVATTGHLFVCHYGQSVKDVFDVCHVQTQEATS